MSLFVSFYFINTIVIAHVFDHPLTDILKPPRPSPSRAKYFDLNLRKWNSMGSFSQYFTSSKYCYCRKHTLIEWCIITWLPMNLTVWIYLRYCLLCLELKYKPKHCKHWASQLFNKLQISFDSCRIPNIEKITRSGKLSKTTLLAVFRNNILLVLQYNSIKHSPKIKG